MSQNVQTQINLVQDRSAHQERSATAFARDFERTTANQDEVIQTIVKQFDTKLDDIQGSNATFREEFEQFKAFMVAKMGG